MAKRNVEYVKEILNTIGISPERVQMFNCSAAEGQRFQNEVSRVSEIIGNIGSNPIKKALSEEKDKGSKKK